MSLISSENIRKLSLYHGSKLVKLKSCNVSNGYLHNDSLGRDSDLGSHEIFEQFNQNFKVEKLNNELQTTKLFLNMVIHDMRNPTVSIKNGIDTVISNLDQVGRLEKSYKEFEMLYSHYEEEADINYIEHQGMIDLSKAISQIKRTIGLCKLELTDYRENLVSPESTPKALDFDQSDSSGLECELNEDELG